MQNAHDHVSAEATHVLPISNRKGQFVTLCAAGYARVLELGVGAIYLSMDGAGQYGYPTWSDMSAPGEAATLARALVNAGKGQRVRYYDRDVTNLRLSNLYLEKGAAKGPTPRLPNLAGGAA